MENVEGVTAEETTAVESVENQTPETQAEDNGETIAEESNESTTQETVEDKAEENDKELQKLISDNPKLKEYIEKQKTEAIDKKESRRKAALKQSNESILKLQESLKQRDAEIEKYRAAQDPEELDINDFETEDEYQLAKLKKELKEETNSERLEEAEEARNAEQQEMVRIAREKFSEQEQEVSSQNPDYADNAKVFESYAGMVDPNDPGFQAFANYLAYQSENGPALVNHLGKNPEKIEALFGKPPAFIEQKIQAYEKEIQSAPKPPAPKPSLPEPPTPAKGAATPKVDPKKLDDTDTYMKWRNSQLKKKRS
jgi:DNA repair exonuclease SbcCD ATPase subunit